MKSHMDCAETVLDTDDTQTTRNMDPRTHKLEELERARRFAGEQLDAAKARLFEFESRFWLQSTYADKSRYNGKLPFYFAPFSEQFPFVDFIDTVKTLLDNRLSRLMGEAKEQGGITTGRLIHPSDVAKAEELDRQAAEIIKEFLERLEYKFFHDLEHELGELRGRLDVFWLERAELYARGTQEVLAEWELLKEEMIEADGRACEATQAYDQLVSEMQRTARQLKKENLLEHYGAMIAQSGLFGLLDNHAHYIEYYVSLLDIPVQGQGVYVLWHNDALEYVGRTKARSVRDRLKSHELYKEGQDYLIGIVFVEEDDKRERLETTLIRTLSPKKNIKDRIPEGQQRLPI